MLISFPRNSVKQLCA